MSDVGEQADLTYRRTHGASRELLFDCLTTPEHLTNFWGPIGTTTPADRVTVDLRPGGVFETVMVNDSDGSEHTMRAVYTVVDRPSTIAWIEEGSGMSTRIDLVDIGGGRTEVVTHQRDVPAAYRSREARAGFATSLDRCDAYVATLVAAGRDGR